MVLGVYAVQGVAGGIGLGALAGWVGFLVFRSETSDRQVRRLFIEFLRLRGALHPDWLESAKSLDGAAMLEIIEEEEDARRGAGAAAGPRAPFRQRLKESMEHLGWPGRVSCALLALLWLIILVGWVDLCSAAGQL